MYLLDFEKNHKSIQNNLINKIYKTVLFKLIKLKYKEITLN